MSRDGFDIADTDTAMLSDPKVLRLARLLRDELRTSGALTLYEAVRLASWKAGERLTLDEALPGWWLGPWEELAVALVEVKLLDAEQRIPEAAFEGWYGRARDRRDRYRQLGARGGRASGSSTERSSASSTERSTPSVPSVRSVRTLSARPSARPSASEVVASAEEARRDLAKWKKKPNGDEP